MTATAGRRSRSPTGSSATGRSPRTSRRRPSSPSGAAGARFDAARGSVRTWTLGIVRNRAIDALRRAAGAAPKLDFDDEAVLESQPAAELTDSEAIRRETSRRVRGVLRELPREQVEVIGLAYFGGFTHSEIAEMLGMPLGTVKGRMRLGLEKIRLALAERMGIEGPSGVLP